LGAKQFARNTNPEVYEPVHLNQQLALDPYQTCSRCFQLIRLAAPCGPRFGLRAYRPIGQTDSFLGILSCLSQSPVRLDQQLAIDPCCPSKAQRRMSSISRPASLRLASRRARQCDLTAHAPDCVRRAVRLSCDNRAPEELRSPGSVAVAGARLGSLPAPPCQKGDARAFALTSRDRRPWSPATAVAGFADDFHSVDGLSELA
jgi:hypothetical protein